AADDDVMDVDEVDSMNEPLEKTFGQSISKRLRSKIVKVVPSASKTPVTTKKIVGVGPKKGWSKVVPPSEKKKKTLKRKEAPFSDSEYNVEPDVPTIGASSRK
ncbi:envelope-like protein, partial [Trifolium medium]|nr:envelope-like protein [Trifolium medium]